MRLIAVKSVVLAVGLLLSSMQSSHAFTSAYRWEDKCSKSDVIVRGVVVDVKQLVEKVEDSREHESETVTDKRHMGPSAVAVFRVTAVVKEGEVRTNGVIFIPCGYNFDESPSELTKTKEYFLFLRSMGSNYFHPLDYISMHRVQKGRVDVAGGDGGGAFGSEAEENQTVSDEEFVKHIRESLPGADGSAPKFLSKNYAVPDDYVQLLYQKALEKTGDKRFAPPEVKTGHAVTWDPWPSVALKALGLEVRDGYSMALSGEGFFYRADAAGHEEFLKLNRTLGIEFGAGR